MRCVRERAIELEAVPHWIGLDRMAGDGGQVKISSAIGYERAGETSCSLGGGRRPRSRSRLPSVVVEAPPQLQMRRRQMIPLDRLLQAIPF